MYLLPFAERLLEFSSALSWFPGQVPTQEVFFAAFRLSSAEFAGEMQVLLLEATACRRRTARSQQ